MRLKNITKVLATAIFLASSVIVFAGSETQEDDHSHDAEHHHASEEKETDADRSEFIQHHLQDAHSFVIWDAMHWVIPLPVILFDDGVQVFSSTKFGHHEHGVAESNGNYYTKHNGIVYNSDESGNLINDAGGHHMKPLDFSITKNVMMIIITCLLMILLFRSLGKSYAKNGGISKGVGRFMEPIVLYIRDEIAIPNIGEKKYMKYLPFLLTTFFFIWFLNLFGLTPLGVNVTGNIAITAALAVLVFLLTNLTGTKDYWKHIFDPLGDAMPWIAKFWLYLILWPIEILGIFIKPFSLLIRLYANMLAGHTVLMSLIALMYVSTIWVGDVLAFGLAFAISLIELLVALLQAYIFTMLAALYFGFASEEHEHHHEEAHAH